MIIPCQKHLFDIPKDVAYLNNAYMSPLMHSVVSAMGAGIACKVAPWTYASDQFFTYPAQARSLAAKIFGTVSDNIAIVPSASYGLQIAANALPLGRGQEVLVMADQFPSNIYPWQEKAKAVGAVVTILPVPDDHDWTREILAAITDKTAIIAVAQTHWASGATLDLKKIRTALDAVGGALVLDLTQSLGAQPFNASDIRPDFAVCATYKWLMGPYSLGFLYIDPKWHDADPLEHNWMNREGSEDFTGLTHYRDTFQSGATKFDMGEKSNPAQLMGAIAAMHQILEWGVRHISETLGAKTEYIAQAVQDKKISVLSKNLRAPHYLGLFFEGGVPKTASKTLADQNIFISVRGPVLRVTPHLYASETDISRFITAIEAI